MQLKTSFSSSSLHVIMTMSDAKEDGFERFVPRGASSLVEDAPGWDGVGEKGLKGPICWKCRGKGVTKAKKGGKGGAPARTCPVCDGKGSMVSKRKERLSAHKPGVITRGRRRPRDWKPSGPMAVALEANCEWSLMVREANDDRKDISLGKEKVNENAPSWWPKDGEELCNLVGTWRILQRVGSHRWTTDDLVTAYVASNLVPLDSDSINYLDLGTGNASVLQMVTWSLLKDKKTVSSVGVEARLEAVQLARRSLSFNLGGNQDVARIHHGDFRDFNPETKYDLVTGTPPYFRVDFAVNNASRLVESAVINQGGMPTARQSAPARCEFRGGVEAYCEAASNALADDGRFVVCENWQNHPRVLAGATKSGLEIVKQVEVSGRTGRDTLFGVYVMTKVAKVSRKDSTIKRIQIAVRSADKDWTREYKGTVLQAMSIPAP